MPVHKSDIPTPHLGSFFATFQARQGIQSHKRSIRRTYFDSHTYVIEFLINRYAFLVLEGLKIQTYHPLNTKRCDILKMVL